MLITHIVVDHPHSIHLSMSLTAFHPLSPGVLLITLSVRLLSIVRPLIPCNPLCVINQLLPDFFSYAAVLGFLYLVFSVAIHTVYMSTATTEHRLVRCIKSYQIFIFYTHDKPASKNTMRTLQRL